MQANASRRPRDHVRGRDRLTPRRSESLIATALTRLGPMLCMHAKFQDRVFVAICHRMSLIRYVAAHPRLHPIDLQYLTHWPAVRRPTSCTRQGARPPRHLSRGTLQMRLHGRSLLGGEATRPLCIRCLLLPRGATHAHVRCHSSSAERLSRSTWARWIAALQRE